MPHGMTMPAAPPPLAPAVAAMTGLQAAVSIALFAPGVLAPALGIDAATLGLFPAAVFSAGMATAVWGGTLVGRFGAFGVARLAMLAVAGSMGLAALAADHGVVPFVLSGLLLALAFGPETPASSALLGRLATPAQRPLVFSIRQTGNQIGALVGSLTLPVLATALDPRLGYLAIAGIAVAAAVVFTRMAGRYDPMTRDAGRRVRLGEALGIVRRDPLLLRLALAAIPYSAMQMLLNTYFITFAVEDLAIPYLTAGALMAAAQAGGLLGRLGWGIAGVRGVPPGRIVAGLGLGMAAASAALALAGGSLPVPVLAVLMVLFGLTASGWNGVFLAEVARLAPAGRVAEATGAILVPGFLGLVLGPVLVALVVFLGGGLDAVYLVLALLAAPAGLSLLRNPR